MEDIFLINWKIPGFSSVDDAATFKTGIHVSGWNLDREDLHRANQISLFIELLIFLGNPDSPGVKKEAERE